MGKPMRTRFANKTSNPEWNQELILYVRLLRLSHRPGEARLRAFLVKRHIFLLFGSCNMVSSESP